MTSGDTELARALATLSTGLDISSVDLGQRFDEFEAVLRAAVPSYCGLWMTVVTDGIAVTITAPGNSSNAPGNSSNAPGNSSTAPGNSSTGPGNSSTGPGNSSTAPGNNSDDGHNSDLSVAAVSSLVIPLSTISLTTSGELVLFAAVAGAFVDLAADLAYVTARELPTFALDTRLGIPAVLPVGVGGFSVIHQAVGILISAGAVPEQAHARIAELAVQSGHDLATAAGHIVSGVTS